MSKDTFRDDPMYSSIVRAVAAILAGGNVVTPVDVLVRIGWPAPDDLEAWRFGRVPYLERAIRCNLTRLRGQGRRTPLRFTKTGDAALERVYGRHFVWPGKGPFHLPLPPEERELDYEHSPDSGILDPGEET